MTTLTGTLSVNGTLVTGSLWLEISQQASAAGGVQVSPSAPSVFRLVNGAITGPGAGPYTVYGNDVLTPANTFYCLTVFGSDGGQLIRGNVSIAGASQDIGAWATASTQVWVPPTNYQISLTGDANGPSTANTVTKIQGKSVAAPPYTPGHVVTVQADQSFAPAAPAVVVVPLPASTVEAGTSFGLAPAVGASAEYARGDHTHGTPALPTPAAIGAAAASHGHAQADVTGLVSDLAAKITTDGTARTIVKKAGVVVGTRRGVNLIEGANVTLTVADDAGNEEVDVTIAATGGSVAPSATVTAETTAGQASAPGVATEYSRGDHTHGTPALPTPAAIGAAAASHGHAQADVTGLVSDLAAKITTDGTARTIVKKAGVVVGTRRGVNLIEGANVTLTVADDAGNEEVDVTIAAAGSGGVADGDKGDITVSGGGTAWAIDPNAVTDAKLRQSAGLSVVGRSANTAGNVADVTAGVDGQVLRRAGTALGFGEVATAGLAANAVTNAKLRQGAATSVIGRSANSLGDVADIAAASDGQVLRRAAGVLGFGPIATAGIADDAVTYAKLQNVSAASRLLGRGSAAGAGDAQELTVGSGLGISGTVLSVVGGVGVFNVKDYGALGNGSTDDTTAIGNAITAAAATTPRGVVFFPPGTYNTTGAFNLNGLSGLQIVGSGPGSTIIRITHASNDLFSVAATITVNLRLEGFTVTSDTVTRTGGWVFRVNNAYNGTGQLRRSLFANLEIQKQVNGLGLQKFELVSVNDVLVWDGVGTTGYALKFGQTTAADVNQGSEARCRNVQVYGNNLSGSAARYAAAFHIEDCDAVELEGCGATAIAGSDCIILANAGGHPPSNHFFNGAIFDATDTGHCLHMTGGGNVANVKFTGCWFASAGQMAGTSNGNGLRCEVNVWVAGEITGCNFFNSRGTGLYIATSMASVAVSGNSFSANGSGAGGGNNDGIYLNIPVNNLGPVLTGNFDGGSNGVSIRTSATTNRIVVVGNCWVSGTSYGTAPGVNASNGA